MKKAVITGGTGFIGPHLAELLLESGYEVHVTGNTNRENTFGTVHACDVGDLDAMRAICTGADYIFHLAARADQECIDQPVESERVNVGGTVSMLEVARTVGVKKFIFASSAMVYGEQDAAALHEDLPTAPNEPYGAYKYFGEQLVRMWSDKYNVPGISLRLFNAYGPGDIVGPHGFVIGRFLGLRMQREPLTIDGDGNDVRDYVHVKDIARAFVCAAENPHAKAGEVINIGSGTGESLNDLAALIGGPVVHLPSRSGARRGPKRRVADISKARTLLQWEPQVSLRDGISALKVGLDIK